MVCLARSIFLTPSHQAVEVLRVDICALCKKGQPNWECKKVKKIVWVGFHQILLLNKGLHLLQSLWRGELHT